MPRTRLGSLLGPDRPCPTTWTRIPFIARDARRTIAEGLADHAAAADYAWRSTQGLCTSYGAPGSSTSGCTPLSRRPLDMMFEATLSHSRARFVGTVSANVARVEVKVPGGRPFVARISRTLKALRTTRHFFLAEGPVRLSKSPRGFLAQRFTLLAYDAHGNLLQHLP